MDYPISTGLSPYSGPVQPGGSQPRFRVTASPNNNYGPSPGGNAVKPQNHDTNEEPAMFPDLIQCSLPRLGGHDATSQGQHLALLGHMPANVWGIPGSDYSLSAASQWDHMPDYPPPAETCMPPKYDAWDSAITDSVIPIAVDNAVQNDVSGCYELTDAPLWSPEPIQSFQDTLGSAVEDVGEPYDAQTNASLGSLTTDDNETTTQCWVLYPDTCRMLNSLPNSTRQPISRSTDSSRCPIGLNGPSSAGQELPSHAFFTQSWTNDLVLPASARRNESQANVSRSPRQAAMLRSSTAIARAQARLTSRPKNPNSGSTYQNGVNNFHTARPRKKFSKDRRKEVAATRKVGACFRCRMWKVTCRQSEVLAICERCANGDPLGGICFRLGLSDCSFYRMGSAIQPAPLRSNIEWATTASVTLTVTVSNVPAAPPLYIDCRQFRPAECDMVADWLRGDHVGATVDIPPFAAVDLRAVDQEVRSKARLFGKAYLGVMEAEGASELVVRIFRGAFTYADENPKSIVNAALDVWSCSRMCGRERSLAGKERLGQERVTDPSSPLHDQVPIPPMLDYQCDMVTIKWMEVLSKNLLKRMWQKLSDKRKEDWLEVFMTVFIMINNIEYVYGIAKCLAHEYGINAGEFGTRVQRAVAEWLERWSWSARHLLHVYQAFFKTGYPFSDQVLVDAVSPTHRNASMRSLMEFLSKFRDFVCYSDDCAKEEEDFDYELYWARKLFK